LLLIKQQKWLRLSTISKICVLWWHKSLPNRAAYLSSQLISAVQFFFFFFYRAKKNNMWVYGHPTHPIFQPPTLTFFIGNYSTLIFASQILLIVLKRSTFWCANDMYVCKRFPTIFPHFVNISHAFRQGLLLSSK
jgi:hypothetical protein